MQSLSDPIRARLLRILDRSEMTVAELCLVLQLPQSTVSRHLKVLSDEAWVTSRREGCSNLYRMRAREVDPAQRRLWEVVSGECVHRPTADQDEARLEQVLESRQSRSQTFFSTSAEKWDRLRSELFGYRMDVWMLCATLSPDSIVGDLGCGTGVLSQTIAPWVAKVYAVDSSTAMIQAARKRLKDRGNVEVRKGELTSLPLEDEQLSVALMSLVLPYVPTPQHVFDQIHRVTRNGGRLVMLDMVPHDRSEYRESMGHMWQGFSESQICSWLQQANWKDIRYELVPPEPEAKGTGLFVASAVRN
ncbi:ArsR/SmtB family transcription factor [Pirellulaceae bacterium SH449]